MATPTASGKPTPGQAHAPPFTPAASSPSAHPHSASKGLKSPVNRMKRSRADTLKGMEHSSSQQGNASTPQSSTLVGSSPGFLGTPGQSHGGPGLGISLSTPAGATPGASAMQRGVSTSFGLSSLGLDSSMLNADREAFTRSKIAEIRAILASKWGQLSRVGVQRVAARLRLECLWETGETEETGILDVAGDGVFLQITFKGETVKDAQLSFPAPEGSGRAKDPDDDKRGSAILLSDMQGWKNEQARGFYVDLDRFAVNMQYLAEIDQMGKIGVSCFDAIDGIYKALKGVEQWWRKRSSNRNGFELLSKGVGWPRIHANGKVGVRLDYWLHAWQVKTKTRGDTYLNLPIMREDDLYGIRIGVTPMDINASSFVVPMRNSVDWFEFLDDIPMDDSNALPAFPPVELQRKEPDACYLPSTDITQADENGNSIQRPLTGIAFVAAFDPPLPISFAAASNILVSQTNEVPRSYASLLFDENIANMQNSGLSISLERKYYSPNAGDKSKVSFRLNNAHTLPALLLKETPFGHPIELLSMLPVLRQWAWLHKVIQNGLGTPVRSSPVDDSHSHSHSRTQAQKPKRQLSAKEVRAIIKAGGTWAPASDTESEDEDVTSLAKRNDAGLDDTVDVSLEIPQPVFASAGATNPSADINITIIIPIEGYQDPLMAEFCLQPGPRLVTTGGSAGDEFKEKLAKMLEATEQLAPIVMWARNEKIRKRTTEKANASDEDSEDQEMADV